MTTEKLSSLRIEEADLLSTQRALVVAEGSATGIHLRALRQDRGEISIALGAVRREIAALERKLKRKKK